MSLGMAYSFAAAVVFSLTSLPVELAPERSLPRRRCTRLDSSGSIAGRNRWGGAHRNAREIARRQRQALRTA